MGVKNDPLSKKSTSSGTAAPIDQSKAKKAEAEAKKNGGKSPEPEKEKTYAERWNEAAAEDKRQQANKESIRNDRMFAATIIGTGGKVARKATGIQQHVAYQMYKVRDSTGKVGWYRGPPNLTVGKKVILTSESVFGGGRRFWIRGTVGGQKH